MMEKSAETAEGEDWTADGGLDSLASHSTSPRKHRRHFMCVCACHAAYKLAYSEKKQV